MANEVSMISALGNTLRRSIGIKKDNKVLGYLKDMSDLVDKSVAKMDRMLKKRGIDAKALGNMGRRKTKNLFTNVTNKARSIKESFKASKVGKDPETGELSAGALKDQLSDFTASLREKDADGSYAILGKVSDGVSGAFNNAKNHLKHVSLDKAIAAAKNAGNALKAEYDLERKLVNDPWGAGLNAQLNSIGVTPFQNPFSNVPSVQDTREPAEDPQYVLLKEIGSKLDTANEISQKVLNVSQEHLDHDTKDEDKEKAKDNISQSFLKVFGLGREKLTDEERKQGVFGRIGNAFRTTKSGLAILTPGGKQIERVGDGVYNSARSAYDYVKGSETEEDKSRSLITRAIKGAYRLNRHFNPLDRKLAGKVLSGYGKVAKGGLKYGVVKPVTTIAKEPFKIAADILGVGNSAVMGGLRGAVGLNRRFRDTDKALASGAVEAVAKAPRAMVKGVTSTLGALFGFGKKTETIADESTKQTELLSELVDNSGITTDGDSKPKKGLKGLLSGVGSGIANRSRDWLSRRSERRAAREKEVANEKDETRKRHEAKLKKEPSWLGSLMKRFAPLIGVITTGFAWLKNVGFKKLASMIVGGVWKGLKWVVKGIGNLAWKGIKGGAKALGKGLGWLMDKTGISKIASKVTNAIKGATSSIGNALKSTLSSIGGKIKGAFTSVKNMVANSRVGQAVSKGITNLKNSKAVQGIAKAGNFVKGIFSKGAQGAATRQVAKSAIGFGLRRVATIGLGILTGPVGWAITGASLAYEGYNLYKTLAKDSDKPGAEKEPPKATSTGIWITKMRLATYGLTHDSKGKTPILLEIEETLRPLARFDKDTRSISWDSITAEIENKIVKLLGLNTEDDDVVNAFLKWFNNRFVPNYGEFLRALWSVDPNMVPGNVNNLTKEQLEKFLNEYRPDVSKSTCNIRIPGYHNKAYNISTDYEAFDRYKRVLEASIKSREDFLKEGYTEKLIKDDKGNVTGRVYSKDSHYKNGILVNGKRKGNNLPNSNSPHARFNAETPPASGSSSSASSARYQSSPMAGGPLMDTGGALEGIRLGKGVTPDSMYNLHPDMLRLFTGMAKEYKQLTGKDIQVNEAFRTYEQQLALKKKYGPRAASPGNSPHEFGLAIDINTENTKELEKLGLLKKYGFTVPVGSETWHLEPAGVATNMQGAKTDRALADKLIQASVGRGGGGYGLIPTARKYGRDIDLQTAIFNSPATATLTNSITDNLNLPTVASLSDDNTSDEPVDKSNYKRPSLNVSEELGRNLMSSVNAETKPKSSYGANIPQSPVMASNEPLDYGEAKSSSNGKGISIPKGTAIELIIQEAANHGITDPRELAFLIANADHESGGFSRTSENVNYTTPRRLLEIFPRTVGTMSRAEQLVKLGPQAIANTIYATKNGNYQPGDGWKYRGSGLIQLTGRANFADVGRYIGEDIVNDPDKVREDPSTAVKTLIGFYKKNNIGAKVRSGDYIGGINVINSGEPMDIKRKRIAKMNKYLADITKDGNKLINDALSGGNSNSGPMGNGSQLEPVEYPSSSVASTEELNNNITSPNQPTNPTIPSLGTTSYNPLTPVSESNNRPLSAQYQNVGIGSGYASSISPDLNSPVVKGASRVETSLEEQTDILKQIAELLSSIDKKAQVVQTGPTRPVDAAVEELGPRIQDTPRETLNPPTSVTGAPMKTIPKSAVDLSRNTYTF